MVATKRLVFGYFLRVITPDMFNDLTIKQGILWGKVIIDTIKEEVVFKVWFRNMTFRWLGRHSKLLALVRILRIRMDSSRSD